MEASEVKSRFRFKKTKQEAQEGKSNSALLFLFLLPIIVIIIIIVIIGIIIVAAQDSAEWILGSVGARCWFVRRQLHLTTTTTMASAPRALFTDHALITTRTLASITRVHHVLARVCVRVEKHTPHLASRLLQRFPRDFGLSFEELGQGAKWNKSCVSVVACLLCVDACGPVLLALRQSNTHMDGQTDNSLSTPLCISLSLSLPLPLSLSLSLSL